MTTNSAALIMAGGRSKRMRAGGCASHKALRHVCGVPLIAWNVAALLQAGFRRLFVSVSVEEVELQTWVRDRGAPWCMRKGAILSPMLEAEPLGTIGAAGRLPADVSETVVVNVDNLTAIDLRALHAFRRETNAALTIASHEEPFLVPWGELALEGDLVTAYREKPTIRVRISSGTYALGRRAMDVAADIGPIDVPRLVALLLAREERVTAYRHAAQWLDVNDEASLVRADALVADAAWLEVARETRGRG